MEEKTRNDILKQYKWDLSNYFKSDEEFKQKINAAKKQIVKLKKYENHILDSSDNLFQTIKLNEELSKITEQLVVYAYLLQYEDVSSEKGQLYTSMANQISDEALKETAFIVPEILNSDFEMVNKMILENENLKQYSFFLERIFRDKPHTLSAQEEKILGEFNSSFNSFKDMFTVLKDSEIDAGSIKNKEGKEIKVNFENLNDQMREKDRKYREEYYTKLWEAHNKNGQTLSSLLINSLTVSSKIAKLRNFSSVLEQSLYEENVNRIIYDNIVNETEKNKFLYAKYFKIIKEKLNLEELMPWDLGLELTPKPITKYKIAEGKEIILKALEVLGKDYQSILNKAFDERWLDLMPSKNKYRGWFSWGAYGKNPVVLANYNEEASDVSGLAHELGHAVNDYYAINNNGYYYGNIARFSCEIPSLFNELLVQNYLLEHSQDKNEKISILNSILKNININLFAVIAENNVEKYLYDQIDNNNSLSDKILCDKYLEEINRFKDNVVKQVDVSRHSWCVHTQFFEEYYLYKYAIGIIGACYLFENANNEDTICKYLEFLKSGRCDYPTNLLKKAGIDLEDKNVIDNVFKVYEKYLKQYEELLNS